MSKKWNTKALPMWEGWSKWGIGQRDKDGEEIRYFKISFTNIFFCKRKYVNAVTVRSETIDDHGKSARIRTVK